MVKTSWKYKLEKIKNFFQGHAEISDFTNWGNNLLKRRYRLITKRYGRRETLFTSEENMEEKVKEILETKKWKGKARTVRFSKKMLRQIKEDWEINPSEEMENILKNI